MMGIQEVSRFYNKPPTDDDLTCVSILAGLAGLSIHSTITGIRSICVNLKYLFEKYRLYVFTYIQIVMNKSTKIL